MSERARDYPSPLSMPLLCLLSMKSNTSSGPVRGGEAVVFHRSMDEGTRFGKDLSTSLRARVIGIAHPCPSRASVSLRHTDARMGSGGNRTAELQQSRQFFKFHQDLESENECVADGSPSLPATARNRLSACSPSFDTLRGLKIVSHFAAPIFA